ncbi:BMP family ABC transporter substrate-binding protein [Pararhodospirillum oryzae]|uniref:BMP family ABC transporter substrate-binding protein n=2 Tax=Pararhodospirillum oryzae TaxID=478448 RepID=A0A512H8R5_9PROT|nr:BMP family ABC transporter substrate-binding protein [Pararhodospirillum oryzae]
MQGIPRFASSPARNVRRGKQGWVTRALLAVALTAAVPALGWADPGMRAKTRNTPFVFGPALLFEVDDIDSSAFEKAALDGARSFSALNGVPVTPYTPGGVAQRAQGADDNERFRAVAQAAVQAGHPVVVGVGYAFSAIFDSLAPLYPNVRFIMLDDAVQQPNVESLLFREEEGAYLVGALAALATRSGRLGFVGGRDIALIRKFGCAFMQGARDQRPDVSVAWRMTGTTSLAWFDPTRGARLARELVAGGADVIFHAAGQTGDGVIQATTGAGRLAIGVDVNQNGQAPGRVLTSMLKRTDIAVFLALKDLSEGHWTPGVRRLGLREGAVDWALDENNIPLIPEDWQDTLDRLRFAILAGQVRVANYEQEGRCAFADFGPLPPATE